MPRYHLLEGSDFLLAADVHLDPGGERLEAFLAAAGRAEAPLVVLGDLFDFWYERRGRGPRLFAATLAALREALAGRRVFLAPGNRDFLAGRALAAAGFGLLPEVLLLGETGVLALHGDLLSRGDGKYRLFRGLVRSRAFRCLSRALPEALAERLATGLAYRPRDAAKKGVLDRQAAARLLREAGCRTLVVGHFHPECLLDYEGPFGRLLVLPSWEDEPLLLRVRSGRIDPVPAA